MALPDYLLTGRAIDAIHAHIAYALGREATPLGVRNTGDGIMHVFDAAAVVKEVEDRLKSSPPKDACWVAALYAVLLAPNEVYRNSNTATAMVAVYVVLARAGFRLVTTSREFFPVMYVVSKERRAPGEVHEGLADWLRYRCSPQKRASGL